MQIWLSYQIAISGIHWQSTDIGKVTLPISDFSKVHYANLEESNYYLPIL